jgi:hypothetical protein
VSGWALHIDSVFVHVLCKEHKLITVVILGLYTNSVPIYISVRYEQVNVVVVQ